MRIETIRDNITAGRKCRKPSDFSYSYDQNGLISSERGIECHK